MTNLEWIKEMDTRDMVGFISELLTCTDSKCHECSMCGDCHMDYVDIADWLKADHEEA